jgi:DnaK suppressor protein
MRVNRQIDAKPAAGISTREMLGDFQRPGRVNPKWRKHFRRLIDLRDHLLQQRREKVNEAIEERPTFSMHMADAGTDSYDRDLALGLLSHEQDAVYEIEQALSRIRNGTYGVCEATGKPISAARLEAIPWTRFAVAAERSLERTGEIQHTQLGPRETVGRSKPPRETEEEA